MGTVTITIGVDIGQKRDPTAIAVVEQELVSRAAGVDDAVHYTTRFLERLPLGTKYPVVARRLEQIVVNTRQVAWEHVVATQPSPWHPPEVLVTVFLDATGVGLPVVDLLRETGLDVRATYFTHGDRRTVSGDQVTLGKAWLVSRLQSLFQTRRLHLPKGHPEAQALLTELLDYEIKVDQNANDRYGAFKTGTHDDLVTALGLAVQEDALTGSWDELDAYYNHVLGRASR
jgi:hypothetical protein